MDRGGDGQIDQADMDKGLQRLFTGENMSFTASKEDLKQIFSRGAHNGTLSYRAFGKLFSANSTGNKPEDDDFKVSNG